LVNAGAANAPLDDILPVCVLPMSSSVSDAHTPNLASRPYWLRAGSTRIADAMPGGRG